MEGMKMTRRFGVLAVAVLAILGSACKSHPVTPIDADPVAVLAATSQAGVSPLTVNFDASASSDADGSIVNYQWDFESDGTIDQTTTTPAVSHVYTAVASYTAEVTVVDNEGNSDSDTLTVRVLTGTWHTQTLDVVGQVGAFSSAAVIGGKPAIAYGDQTNHREKFVIAANNEGTAWGIPLTIDANQRGGAYTALAEIAGRPGVAFLDDQQGRVMYARGLDNLGQTWSEPLGIGIPGAIVDIALIQVQGNPAIAFVDETQSNDGDPVYIRALDSAGTSWDDGLFVDDTSEDVSSLDMKIINGVPAVGYVEESSRDLRFVQSRDVTGSSWFLPDDAVSVGAVGNMMSLASVGNRPMMAFLETSGPNTDVYAVRSNDADGIAWPVAVAVDGGGDSEGAYISLALVGGLPGVAYYNLSLHRLEYAQATTPAGTSWDTSIVVDNTADVGQFCSLISVGGAPGISYYDATDGDLKWSVLE
jgi:PKD repeat protein